MINDNPIIIDVNSRRSKKQKIRCVICKIELTCINPEENRYKCPRCKNTYQLGGFEIIPQEDILESSHDDYDDDADNAGLLCVEGDEFNNDDDNNESDSIPIPKYMKNSLTTRIIEYREE